MWRGIVRVTSIIAGIVLGISGLVGSLRIASENPFLAMVALAVTVVAVLVSIAPAMLIVEISEDVEDLRGEIRYLQEKLNKTESKISEKIEQSENKPPVERIFSESSRTGTRNTSKRPGDWTCKRCGKTNQAIITRCSCGAAKGEI